MGSTPAENSAPTGQGNCSRYVDIENGTVSREIFVDETIFKHEMENLFTRAWLFVGHEAQIPDPGDFFVSRMGGESVILTRASNGEVNVLLNSCRHRGMKVCRYDKGNTLQFTCPYHGWSYSIDGTLVTTPGELFGVPLHKGAYGGKLDKAAWSLYRVPRMANYHGLIFASWDPEAPSFDAYAGAFHHWLDNLSSSLGGEPGGATVFEGVQKWRVKSNWKFVAENFLGDHYHAPTSHISVETVGIGPAGSAASRHGMTPQAQAARRSTESSTSFVNLGHGATDSIHFVRDAPTFVDHPELTEYFADLNKRRRERRTAEGLPLGAAGPATLFPNMSFHASGFPRTILVAHPISPWETEMWRWFVVDKDAPDNVRDWLRHYYMRYSGPAGMTEQDDMENWDYATNASRGTIARRLPYNYAQGLGMTRPSELPGAVESTFLVTEENARNFYHRWAQFVDGDKWSDLMANT